MGRKALLYVSSVEKEPMMQGRTLIVRFAIRICEIVYILERPDGVCHVQLKNGTVIATQESFETVTGAYEETAKLLTSLDLEVLEPGPSDAIDKGVELG